MRIVSGHHRGHPLQAPKSGTRPTTDRTREAIFNLLAARVRLVGIEVLDLFAGSGALGLEALSRGASRATFVERAGPALRVLRANVETLGVGDAATLVRADALRWLDRPAASRFDLILADPPYDLPDLDRLPDLALPHLADGGLLVLEHDTRHAFDDHPALDMSRAYGRTVVSLFAP